MFTQRGVPSCCHQNRELDFVSVNWQLPKLRQGPGLHLIWCKFALSVPDFRLSGANGSCSRHKPQHTLNLHHDDVHSLMQNLGFSETKKK